MNHRAARRPYRTPIRTPPDGLIVSDRTRSPDTAPNTAPNPLIHGPRHDTVRLRDVHGWAARGPGARAWAPGNPECGAARAK